MFLINFQPIKYLYIWEYMFKAMCVEVRYISFFNVQKEYEIQIDDIKSGELMKM